MTSAAAGAAKSEIHLSLPAGDHVRIATQGAQVLSWQTAEGQERLYLSPKTAFDGQTPIRGGVPVCFPQFNNRVLGDAPLHKQPKHGFARILPWRLESQTASPAEAVAILTLQDNPQTRTFWPHAFTAQMQVRLTPAQLHLEFSVRNTDAVAWPFALALHTYLQVHSIEQTRLHGLEGQRYWDAVQHLQNMTLRQLQGEAPLAFDGEMDRVYTCDTPLSLQDSVNALQISQSESLSETVVWNPGHTLCASMVDMPVDGYQHMLCVEAACIDKPVTLEPGALWTGWQHLSVV